MVFKGQEKTRCILDDTLLIAKLIFLDHMPELNRCVLLRARRVIERDVHHLPRGAFSILVRVAEESWRYRCITTEKEDALLIDGQYFYKVSVLGIGGGVETHLDLFHLRNRTAASVPSACELLGAHCT